jgi:hypothetical protein
MTRECHSLKIATIFGGFILGSASPTPFAPDCLRRGDAAAICVNFVVGKQWNLAYHGGRLNQPLARPLHSIGIRILQYAEGQ